MIYKSVLFFKEIPKMNYFFVNVIAFALCIFGLRANTHEDLEIYGDRGSIFSCINRTQTGIGRDFLIEILQSPITNTVVLGRRQEAIKALQSNARLNSQLAQCLRAYATQETAFSRLLSPRDSVAASTIEGLYYQTGPLNKLLGGKLTPLYEKFDTNPTALGAGVAVDFLAVATSAFTHYGMALIAHIAKENVCSGHAHGHSHKKKHAHQDNAFLKHALSVVTLVHGWEIVPATINVWRWQDKLKILKVVQAQLIPVARQLLCIRMIYDIVKQHPEFCERLTHFNELEKICTGNCSEKLKQLIALLEKRTFSGESSFFSHMGNVLAAYKLLQEVGNELTPAFVAIGEIDTYCGLANLVTEYEKSKTPYTYAQYVNAQTPFVLLDEFWHPLVLKGTSVTNSIRSGSFEDPRNLLVTAENEAGKTTCLKSIAVCAYLAQTVGIAPARTCTITPFTHFKTSIVQHDDLTRGYSSYRAAKNTAQDIENTIAGLEESEFVLVVHDEPFQKTNEEKGTREAFTHLEKIGCDSRVVCISASHYRGLLQLSKEAYAQYTVQEKRLIPGTGIGICYAEPFKFPQRMRA